MPELIEVSITVDIFLQVPLKFNHFIHCIFPRSNPGLLLENCLGGGVQDLHLPRTIGVASKFWHAFKMKLLRYGKA